MVRTRFPGKPSKAFNRRRCVSGVNNDDTQSIRDTILGLSYFNYLFNRNEEDDNSFHGFSPHEDISPETPVEISNTSRNPKKASKTQPLPKKPESSHTSLQNAFSPISGSISKPGNVKVSSKTNDSFLEPTKPQESDSSEDTPCPPTLSGKFVLPSRSAHSSRVIIPNKRFLQSPDMPIKKQRSVTDSSENSVTSETSVEVETFQPAKKVSATKKCHESSTSVKFVLRKPRLKIKSQPLPSVGGPFSSPAGSSLSLQGVNSQAPTIKKVFCGVCGLLRTFKFFQHAKKFGIFSCVPCRKFILRMIKAERNNTLKALSCTSGLGSCRIRENWLEGPQTFSLELGRRSGQATGEERCPACWLSLCLRSFHMPGRLVKRLAAFLPQPLATSSLLFKPPSPQDESGGGPAAEVTLGGGGGGQTTEEPAVSCSSMRRTSTAVVVESSSSQLTAVRRRVKAPARTDSISVRRGLSSSSGALRLLPLNQRGGGRVSGVRETETAAGSRPLKMSLLLSAGGGGGGGSGPRVKHVCRSASLVLGQPLATFTEPTLSKGSSTPEGSTVDVSVSAEKLPEDAEEVVFHPRLSEQEKSLEVASERARVVDKDFDYPPVARTLQELGRANCELLDGMESQELRERTARVSIDFWESYDPEEVAQSGFPLLGLSPLRLHCLCFLCGSAGLEKLIHCGNCCEPYHPFCVSSRLAAELEAAGGAEEAGGGGWWRLDWLCPKCTVCEVCARSGGGLQLACQSCHKSYHSACCLASSSTTRLNIYDNNWVCPNCLFCKSCKDPSVHLFVGNMPLCKACFKLRKKGNYCPLCQCCYDENDYNTKMMECAECKCWIHAGCEGLSNEKYQVLSYLPPSIEFICRLCCRSPPAPWSTAVEAELKAGYLNVIKVLSKNKTACAMFKASPKKVQRSVCMSCNDLTRKPIHLSNLLSVSAISSTDGGDILHSDESSPDRELKSSSDLGLLTPKLTKDDEESLKTVKTDFLNLVNKKRDETAKHLSPKKETSDKNNQLLTIAFDKLKNNTDDFSISSSIDKDTLLIKETNTTDKICNCQKSDSFIPSLSLLTVKQKAANDEYRSVVDFHSDMEKVVVDIGNSELAETYNRCLKQIFPWFDPSLEDSFTETVSSENGCGGVKKVLESPRKSGEAKNKINYPALKGLLNLEPSDYYIGLEVCDGRSCLLCKKVGEGRPEREGRLLYCGQNDWVHTNCALWSSEVFEEIDGSLQNVQSAVSRARLIRCSQCGKKGASIGCCAKSCPAAFHFGCALAARCVFLESKEIFCQAHESHRGDKEIHNEADFVIRRSVYVELDHKKLKDVLRSQVRVYIGSLEVSHLGEIVPELSDRGDIIIPCEYYCSRLFWSCKEPWKIVRYHIKTKITNNSDDFSYDPGTNYTIDHSLEFTPPPSPIDSLMGDFNPDAGEKDIKAMVNRIIETICVKEEENLSDQQGTDLLPPELTDVIYDDLPKDFLDRVTVNDIFTKMSFDDILTDKNNDLIEENSTSESFLDKFNSKSRRENKLLKVNLVKPKHLDKRKLDFDLEKTSSQQWKRSNILQVDGAMDLSESDLSNDSCDVHMKAVTAEAEEEEEEPVKCGRCRRTYRTKLSYERHLSTCTSDYLSLSESEDLSEDEKTQDLPDNDETSTKPETSSSESSSSENSSDVPEAIEDSNIIYSIPVEIETEQFQHNSFENSVFCVNNSNYESAVNESVVNVNYTAVNSETLSTSTYPSTVDNLGLQQPTIILQQMPNENPSFIQPSFQETQPSNFQYITAINTQEKTQFLASNSMGSTYQFQQPLSQQIVPTVLGTILQSNGVEQIVLNNPTQSLDMYSQQQNNMILANTPVIVGMETVVSNTVMQSSRFITGTPGVLTSYSATTTQVIQAAKPVVDMPQSFVVFNSNPPQLVENNTVQACVQSLVQNQPIPNQEWNNYKICYTNEIKPKKEVTYQIRQVTPMKQDVNGFKTVNPPIIRKDDNIVIKPLPPKPQPSIIQDKSKLQTPIVTNNNLQVNSKPTLPVKAVQLFPSPSTVQKEKPQQAVAPVVIKKVIETPKPATITDQQNPAAPPHSPLPPQPPSHSNGLTKTPLPSQNTSILPSMPELFNPPLSNTTVNGTKPLKTDASCSKTHQNHKLLPPLNKKKPNTLINNTNKRPREENNLKFNGIENNKKRKIIQEEPTITFEISSEDGFYFNTSSVEEAWNKVYETVQNARKAKNLPPLTENPFSSPDTMLRKLMGLGNNSMKYLLEQLPGISSCSKYKPTYHKKPPSALEVELYSGRGMNPTGSARTEGFKHCRKTYDMFSWLASRHRRPPKLLPPDTDPLNGNSRRATSLNLPMAMRFRHLKETSRQSVGVFRSDIHGRGLFCLRDIEASEMVIEYAGEVIRSALTDKRERHYTEKGIGCYMFRIDDKFVVDATMKGNAARFINHSCEPNCYSRVIDILGKKHILIFALRKIVQGEELTYDYKFPLEEDKINCHCLSRKCRKYLN